MIEALHLHLSGDARERGFRAGEVLYFSFGSFSDYCISTVVIVARDVAPLEIAEVVEAMPVKYNDEVRMVYAYRWHGDFVDAMVLRGAFHRAKASEVHTSCDVQGHSGTGMLCMDVTTRDD